MTILAGKLSYLYYLYDKKLSYLGYKSYSFWVPRGDVKEQTLPRAGRKMEQGHESRGPRIGCRPRHGGSGRKNDRGGKLIVTNPARNGNCAAGWSVVPVGSRKHSCCFPGIEPRLAPKRRARTWGTGQKFNHGSRGITRIGVNPSRASADHISV